MREGWTYKKFSDVFDLQMGKTPSRDNPQYWGGDNTWVSIADIQQKYISSSKENISDKAIADTNIRIVKKGTVIMSFKLTVGRCAIAEKDLYTNEAIMAFNPINESLYSPDYIYYYLRGFKWVGANKAVMGMTLNKKSLSSNTFAFPSLSEQERIVSELDLLSGIIEKKKEQLKAYDQLAQSIFYDMFGDPIENEKGWEVKKLGEVCEISSAKRVFIEEVVDSGIPFIRGTELTSLSKLARGEKMNYTLFITQEHYERLKAITGVPKVGDLLIPSINSDGIVWMVDTDEPLYFKDGRVLWVHVNNNVFTSETLQKIMSIQIRSIFSIMNGATFAELKLFVLRDMPVPIPALPLQQSFASKIEAIERQKELIKQSIAETETLFNSRMDYYFN